MLPILIMNTNTKATILNHSHHVSICLHRVGSFAMTQTVTALSWTNQAAGSPAVLLALDGRRLLSSIKGLHRCPTPDLHRSLGTSREANADVSVQYITVATGRRTHYTTEGSLMDS